MVLPENVLDSAVSYVVVLGKFFRSHDDAINNIIWATVKLD
jgi:hypothetical protein